MRVLLVSTYELGHQPLGIAGPAAALRALGHEVHGLDLAVQPWDEQEVDWAEAIAISVPMHTALRLGLEVAARARHRRPAVPIALHGLYAGVAAGNPLFGPADLLVAGEAAPALEGWLEGPGPAVPVAVEIGAAGRVTGGPPDRSGLPSLELYSHLVTAGGTRLAGSVEATRGCSHRCRHCPVPVVYGGRTRVVAVEDVLADVDALVRSGAEHLTFGDPDFLNRPRHALEVARAVHAAYPDVTFDVTVKVEHILRHAAVWPELAASGLLFVVSAFESVDDRVLELLAKGHTRTDAVSALGILRSVGVTPRPSLLPFTPWTTFDQLVDLLDFVADHDLVPDVDPVQYGIRLLLPPGSLLLDDPDPELAAALGGFDAAALTWRWAGDPAIDRLQVMVAATAEEAAGTGQPYEETYRAIRALVHDAAGRRDLHDPAPSPGAGTVRPRLSESWYCCAEPTGRQLDTVGSLGTSGCR